MAKTKTNAYEEHNCVLVMELQDGTELRFKCWLPTHHVDFPKSYDDDAYERFWDYHHPATNWCGTKAGGKLFYKLYDSEQFATMYYDDWLKNKVDNTQRDAIMVV